MENTEIRLILRRGSAHLIPAQQHTSDQFNMAPDGGPSIHAIPVHQTTSDQSIVAPDGSALAHWTPVF
jgi:hypothetical protein